MNIAIIYWSGTGNTEKMAELVEQGINEAGNTASLIQVSDASLEDFMNADVVALASPSMGSEVLEESEFQPYYDEISDHLGGKEIALFGSYDWGDGEWMRNWQEDVESKGALLKVEPLIVNGYPDGEDELACIEFGKQL